MRSLLALALAVSLPAWGQVSDHVSDEVRMGRYSLVNTSGVAYQNSPLQVVIDTTIPREIINIHDGIEFLLLRSGYKLADPELASPQLQQFYELPIPEVHRDLGPVKLIDVLDIITGEAFTSVIDPVHRLISFELNQEMVQLLEGSDNG
ncbi:pili assembly chaperone [Endozoicomonas sp. ALC066]|uniref:PFGI-1 class ICE element type IV pilus protein PilL2 n=1 Tax=Endozoicomonas sp. ALC066 TaxID=3403078 RepID=UPI003BB56B55